MNFYLYDIELTNGMVSIFIINYLIQCGIKDYAVIRDYYEVEEGFCLGNTVDGMIKEAMTKELNFPSGSQFSYSNIGYTLLDQIIENTTEQPFHSYLKSNILKPLEMHSSFIHTTDYTVSDDEVIGNRWDDKLKKHVLDDIVIGYGTVMLHIYWKVGQILDTYSNYWVTVVHEQQKYIPM